MKQSRPKKLLSIIAALSLLLNQFLPIAAVLVDQAYAQEEATDSAELVVEPSPTPEISPSPELSPSPEVIVPSPEPSVEPLPEVQTEPESTETTEPPKETSPPPFPSPEISPSPELKPEVEGQLSAIVLPSTFSFPVIDLDPSDIFSAQLFTDKPDYAPTEIVIISGTDFSPNETYTLIISSQDEPAVTHEDSVTTVDQGTFVYSYQLDGNYRPNYKVEVKSGEVVVAETTFTDSRTTDSATLNGGSSVTVNPGNSVTAIVTGTISGGDVWHSTSYQITTSSVATNFTCVDTIDHDSNGTYTTEPFTLTAPSNLGTYNVFFRISGNDCSSSGSSTTTPIELVAGIIVVADTIPPVCPVPTFSNFVRSHYVAGNTIYYSPVTGNDPGSFKVSIVPTDSGSGIQKVTFPNIFVTDGGDVASSPYENTYSWWNSSTFSGSADITCVDNSPAHNTATSTFNIIKDNTFPTLTTVTLDDYTVKNGTTINITSDGADTGSGIGYCHAFWSTNTTLEEDVDLGDLGSDCDGSITVPNGAGTFYVIVRAGDNVGYYPNPIASAAVIVDNTAPTTTDNTGFGGQSYFGSKTFTLTPTDNSGGSGIADTKYCVNNSDVVCTPNISGTSVTVTCPVVATCTKQIFYQSIDNSGNEEPIQRSYSFTIINDTTAPTTTDDIDGNWHNSDVTVNLICTDNSGGTGCGTTYYTTNGSTPTTSSSSGNSFILSDEGTYTVKYFSVDIAGNLETVTNATNQVKIDKTLPVIGSHANISSEASGPTGAVITYTEPDVNDNVVAPIIVSCSPASGSTFSIGNTTVTCNAVDSAGNHALATTFSVNVVDTTAPSVSVSSPSEGSLLRSLVTLTANASDLVGVTKVEFLHSSPTAVKIGEDTTAPYSINWDTTSVTDGSHSIWAIAYDAAGNNQLSIQINVNLDNTAPTVELVDSDGDVYNLATTSPHTIKVTFSENISNMPTIGVNPPPPDPQTVNDCADGDLKTFCFNYAIESAQEVQHRIYVSAAQDATGNTMINDNSHTFIIDTLAPTATIAYDITAPTNTDVVATITPSEPSSVTNNGGYFNYTFTDNGSFTFELADMYGNPGSATATVSNIDKTPPPVPSALDIQDASDSGVSNTDNITMLNPIFDVLGVADIDYYQVYWCSIDSCSWTQLFSLNPGTQKTWNTSGFGADWTYRLALTALDALGNESAMSPYLDWIIDINGPTTAEITSPQNNENIKGTYTINANASGDYSGVERIEFWYASVGTKIGEDFNSPYSIDWDTSVVTDGSHDLWVKAFDFAGNITTSNLVTVNVDNTIPTLSANPPAGDYMTDQSVDLLGSDAGTGIDKIYYTLDGTDPDYFSLEYTGLITVDHDLTIKAIAYDKVGNASTVLTAVYGIAPVISGETSSAVGETTTTITWTTDDPATSRVIYDTVSHDPANKTLDIPFDKYGYANTTDEFDTLTNKTTTHSVSLIGLSSGTTYYYRTVSHGSPEAVSGEQIFITNTSSSSSSSGTGGTSGPTICNDQKPGSAPTLLSAIAGYNSVTLTWSKASDPVTYYLVAYGTSANTPLFGNPNVGSADTTSYTVTNLSGGTAYYFKVRAGNNCMPGDYSNEIAVTPSGGFISGPASGFAEGILGVKDQEAETEDYLPSLTDEQLKILGETKSKSNSNWWLGLIAAAFGFGLIAFALRRQKH